MWVCSAKWNKFGRRTVFYDEVKGECDLHGTGDVVMCLCEFNGHIGRYIE